VSLNHRQADFDVFINLEGVDEIAEAVFDENTQNLAVSIQVAIGASDDTYFSNTEHGYALDGG
jgi:hypothetical protein